MKKTIAFMVGIAASLSACAGEEGRPMTAGSPPSATGSDAGPLYLLSGTVFGTPAVSHVLPVRSLRRGPRWTT